MYFKRIDTFLSANLVKRYKVHSFGSTTSIIFNSKDFPLQKVKRKVEGIRGDKVQEITPEQHQLYCTVLY